MDVWQSSHIHDEETTHSKWMTRVSAVLMTGLGVLFAWLIASGDIRNYINTEFIAYTYLGAGILLVLGLYSVAVAFGWLKAAHSPHVGLAAAGVIAVPLLFGAVVPSRPLGLDAVTGDIDSADVVARTESTQDDIPLDDTSTWNVLEWQAAYYTANDFTLLENQPADVIGFVRFEPNDGDGYFRVTRFMVSCCVADTLSVDLPVAYDPEAQSAAELSAGDWVQVTGNAAVAEISGDVQPMIVASSIRLLDEAPESAYLYP